MRWCVVCGRGRVGSGPVRSGPVRSGEARGRERRGVTVTVCSVGYKDRDFTLLCVSSTRQSTPAVSFILSLKLSSGKHTQGPYIHNRPGLGKPCQKRKINENKDLKALGFQCKPAGASRVKRQKRIGSIREKQRCWLNASVLAVSFVLLTTNRWISLECWRSCKVPWVLTR